MNKENKLIIYIKNHESRFIIVLMIITAILITIAGFLFHQQFIRILPLYFSLIIAYLNSKVNRYASLMGGLNSILYAAIYLSLHLYGNAAYAFFFSFPLQIITFIRWSKKPWGKSTVFRSMSGKLKILTAAIFAVCWISLFLFLHYTDADFIVLDCTGTLLGILTTILMMLSFIEYAGLMFINCFVSILLNFFMMIKIPGQTTYFIYSVYSLICTTITFIRARQIYARQIQESAE